MRTVIKTIITTVLLSTLLAMAGTVEARLKYYRYNDNIPMVEMSLNMMVAMGVLEPIPSRLVHDGNPYHRMVNASYGPYSRSGYTTYPERSRRYSNNRYNDYLDGPIDPYDSYYGGYNDRYYGSRYGYSPDYPRYRTWGSQWDSPWADRLSNQWDGPWGNTLSPWDYQQGNPWNSTWGSPWGNQWSNPWDSGWGNQWGNQWNNPWNSGWGNQWGNQWNNPWNSGWGNQWGNQWSNPWMNPWSSQPGYSGAWPYTPGYSNLPLSPGINLGDDGSKNNSYQSDDASRQNPGKDGYKAEKTSWSGYPSRPSYQRSSYHGGNQRPYRKLNGLWIGDNGAMLGIRGHRFLWYDDNNRYSKGQLVRSPTMMKARLEGSTAIVRYHYQLHGNELVIMSSDGKMHTFNRMPLVELPAASAGPHAAYTSYKPVSNNTHVSYANFGSGHKANKRSLNSRNNSDRAGRATDTNRHTHSMAPRDYYSDERSTAQSPHAPYAGNGSRDYSPSASRPADSDSDFYASEAFINDAGHKQQQITPLESTAASSAAPASTIPLYKQYQPAAGRAKPGNGADSAGQTVEDISVESSTWTDYAGLDMNDPNTYLYSYLRDNDNKRTSSSASTDPDNSDGSVTVSSTGAEKSDRSNIWKPNNSYPDSRGYIDNSQSNHSAQNTERSRSELTANSAMTRFAWPDGGSPWD
jgi:hypothetical protein